MNVQCYRPSLAGNPSKVCLNYSGVHVRLPDHLHGKIHGKECKCLKSKHIKVRAFKTPEH